MFENENEADPTRLTIRETMGEMWRSLKFVRENTWATGIGPFDDAFRGVAPDDLVVLAAGSGVGKTELAAMLARSVSRAGKKVCFFGLEAQDKEIEKRLLYKYLSKVYFDRNGFKQTGIKLHYDDWMEGQYDYETHPQLIPYFVEAEGQMLTEIGGMEIVPKEEVFGIERFTTEFEKRAHDTDLMVVDHLHHLDLDYGESEMDGYKRITHKMRTLTMKAKTPILLLGQLRKPPKGSTALPDKHDIYGASAVANVATKIMLVTQTQDYGISTTDKQPTFFVPDKGRTRGAVRNYAMLCSFDRTFSGYEKQYDLYKKHDMSHLQNENEMPHWAQNARLKPGGQSGFGF